MIITLIEILLVFFIFRSKWMLNFIVSSIVYNLTKDKRFHTCAVILLVYQNIWIFESVSSLFGDFNLSLALAVLLTEILIYALAYGVSIIMSLFSQSQTGFVNYPGAFITSLLAIPAIDLVLNIIHNLIGFVIIP